MNISLWQMPGLLGRTVANRIWVLLLLTLVGCGGGTTTTPPPTPTPNPSYELTVVDLGIPQKAYTAPVVGKVPDDQMLHVGVTFKTNQAVLDDMGKNGTVKVGDKTSSKDLANKLGISEETYQKIKTFFGVENATVTPGKLRTNLTVDAKAKTLAALLHTNFVLHKLGDRTYYTPDPASPPKLPKLIADPILAITGLDNYSLPPQHTLHTLAQTRQLASRSMKQMGKGQADCSPLQGTVITPQIAHAYGYDQFWKAGWSGKGHTVNFIEIDGVSPPDLNNFFECVGYKGKVDVVTIGKNAPAPGLETQLDLEMVAGTAPDVNMVTYQADLSQVTNFADAWTLVNDALQALINNYADKKDTGDVVSMSLSQDERAFTLGNYRAMHQSLDILTNVLHMSVFASSGDCGAFASSVYSDLSVGYPASDTNAIAVGGTTLGVDDQGNRVGEVVWSDGSDKTKCTHQWGTGGGVSTVSQQPTWQIGPGVKNHYSTGGRQVPDIAAVADSLAVYMDGQWTAVGGTSAATPVWAAGMILLNQGFLDQKGYLVYGPDTFYSVQNTYAAMRPLYDVTRGDNLYYQAGPGWDYPTGLGTPNLPNFFNALLKSV